MSSDKAVKTNLYPLNSLDNIVVLNCTKHFSFYSHKENEHIEGINILNNSNNNCLIYANSTNHNKITNEENFKDNWVENTDEDEIIITTPNDQSIQLSLSQKIDPTSSPTFNSMYVTNLQTDNGLIVTSNDLNNKLLSTVDSGTSLLSNLFSDNSRNIEKIFQNDEIQFNTSYVEGFYIADQKQNINNNTHTPVIWNQRMADPLNWFPVLNSSIFVYQGNETSFWIVQARLRLNFQTNADNGIFGYIMKNNQINTHYGKTSMHLTGRYQLIDCILRMEPGDTMEIYFLQQNGGIETIHYNMPTTLSELRIVQI